MTSEERSEVVSMVASLRNEMYRQMGQFERDKVGDVDERARAALIEMRGQIWAIESQVAGLAARVTLCEGRLTRLEAKP